MKYYNLKDKNQIVSFKEAVLLGLGNNKGLFVPEYIPQLSDTFHSRFLRMSNVEIAHEVLKPYVSDDLSNGELLEILNDSLNFVFPVVPVENNAFSLELFHGPTMAFKDVGARFMSRCLGKFSKEHNSTVLVATSGDTGSAVANGFHNVENTEVVILFPKNKVSPFQEHQMTSLKGNIKAVEVEGTFDDCQHLVKQAFSDDNLKDELHLSSANSINIARLLPQMIYYFIAVKQIRKLAPHSPIVFSVPSGNFGNITAGLIAKKMGLENIRFIAANNYNDTFHQYHKTGVFKPKKSISTYSNAMDVGNPSNFDRLLNLYNNSHQSIIDDIDVFSVSNNTTLKEIKNCFAKNHYLLDPHGAVAFHCLKQKIKPGEIGIFLETAAPRKFSDVVKKAIPGYEIEDPKLIKCEKEAINNSFIELKQVLQNSLMYT